MQRLSGDHASRLKLVAAEVAMQTHPGLDDAIALAEELVGLGRGGQATLEVASQQRGAVRSDVEPCVRDMLEEFGLGVPPAHEEAGRYRLLCWLFGHADLPISAFEGPFYARLIAWDRQSPLDRTLMAFLHERDQVSSPSDRRSIEQKMRAAVRTAIPLA